MGCAEADDIAQEAFVRAWRAIHQYDGRARFRTWLTRIAWRCLLDQRRLPEPPAADLIETSPEFGIQLRSLLEALPPRERAVLILCDGHGWTHAEAAEMLEIPLGTLKSTALRAKARARALWIGGSA
jgi:RNA polymerase sigma factor (sigma-70 family)